MLGTIVNALAIVVGGFAGVLLKGGLPEKMSTTIMQGVGLAVILLGLSSAMEGMPYIMEIIFFLVIGTVIGEWIDIEKRLEKIGDRLEVRFSRGGSTFSKGFVAASLLYCVGAMAIMGALESGLNGNHEILFAKSVLDGITSIVFASTLGVGVIFSAASVLIYQGSITLLAGGAAEILTETVVLQMSATGGLLIVGLGLSMVLSSKIRVANMLPSVLLPIVYHVIQNLIL
ncbi:DUF554 domain-containing protein [Fusibacter tunisiensis]|uniref:Membrane protein YqgA involved in biofilm formation n=1 Tax=Fusibacter tunisiensis TaxID=1008308 RepID=A0ABS2MPQ4_9FIRM|nr:DUF554 domain-containing protein [Fusibacter tunisiensis]MBM7561363.1 putative membrane protein YqgA involved in biofilm formation [Fusibacter tunisiensis]